ncbi:MAG TPA: NAD(P)H-dependent oxidoreductase [Bryobacteraceae bacterium]|nr:NAD(P)H-dependent oxidoreductase [Bryobacteraceae bacterium]
MKTLLRIDSSPLPGNASFSRRLTDEFVDHWLRTHRDGTVVSRDLTRTGMPPVGAAWVAAAHTPEESLTPAQRQTLALSDELIRELKDADEYVFGVAMHNFSIPAVLKLWIDEIVRTGQTFAYENGGPKGLLRNKKATFLVATGGVYSEGSPMAGMNFVEPYLRTIFRFIGVTDVEFVYVSGTGRLLYGIDRETILEPALASIQARFAVAA